MKMNIFIVKMTKIIQINICLSKIRVIRIHDIVMMI
jgi:hypothetical protein